MEHSPVEMSRAMPVESGTVMMTNRKVFFTACKK